MSILRDVSLILLALEGVVFTLLALAALAAINYGLVRFRWWHTIPRWFGLLRGYLAIGQRWVEQACRIAVTPIMTVAAAVAAVSGGARVLVNKDEKRSQI